MSLLTSGHCLPSETPPERAACTWWGCPCGGTFVAITRSVEAANAALLDHRDALKDGPR